MPEHKESAESAGRTIQLPFDVLPIIQEAQDAFRCALPRLLQERAGQWVAYLGAREIAYGRSKAEVFKAATDAGVDRLQLLVRKIKPSPTYSIGPGLV